MLETSTSRGTDKLLGLEGLRFLATLSVLLWHYQHFSYVGDRPVGLVRSELPYHTLLFPFYEAGEYGVWIFWCISGFIFFWKYRDAISHRSVSGWSFFVFRLSRLYPLHLVTLLLVALLQPIYLSLKGSFFVYQNNDLSHFVAQLFMASDWTSLRSDSFNAPIWSVSVEVLVYVAFFLTLRFVTKSPLFNLVVVLACLSAGTQVAACLAFFYAGGLGAIGRRAVADATYRPTIELIALGAAVVIPVAAAILSLRIEIVDWVLLLAYTPILLFCLSIPMGLPRPVERLLETAGNMTYSCYLLHFPIQLAIALCFALARQPIPYYDHLFWAVFVLPTLLASHLTYRYFEAPTQRLFRSILLRKQAAGRTSPAPL